MATTFADIQSILDAIAAQNGGISGSPHGVFWRLSGNHDLDYNAFIKGQVPVVDLPIIDPTDPKNSNFFVILTNPDGLQAIPQMPAGGPFVTDAGYQATLSNGKTLSGQEIQETIADWLANGFPK
jgi:hypothetical protein